MKNPTTIEEIIAEFEKEFPSCDCHNNFPPHFGIVNFLIKSLQKVEDSVREEISIEVEKKKLPIPNPYGTTVNLNRFNAVIDEVLGIINKK